MPPHLRRVVTPIPLAQSPAVACNREWILGQNSIPRRRTMVSRHVLVACHPLPPIVLTNRRDCCWAPASLRTATLSSREAPCRGAIRDSTGSTGSARSPVAVRSARTEQNVVGEEKAEEEGAGTAPGQDAYKDSWLDLVFINGCRKVFGRLAGWQSPRSWSEGYLGMVEVSHALMRGKSAAQQQAAVLQGFPSVPRWFRKLFPYSEWGAALNARITPAFFEWLVGPCEVVEVEVGGKMLRSGVQIKKCRYLETSGCTGMCVNLCKVPTQYFFTSELGMPLTMEPNFEDLSCRMIFGQVPPSLQDDPALKQGCFSSCPSASTQIPCLKLK